MGKYVVLDMDETGRVWSTYGPFRSRKEADAWKVKTLEQMAGIVGPSNLKGDLRIVPMQTREELRTEMAHALAKFEKEGRWD